MGVFFIEWAWLERFCCASLALLSQPRLSRYPCTLMLTLTTSVHMSTSPHRAITDTGQPNQCPWWCAGHGYCCRLSSDSTLQATWTPAAVRQSPAKESLCCVLCYTASLSILEDCSFCTVACKRTWSTRSGPEAVSQRLAMCRQL